MNDIGTFETNAQGDVNNILSSHGTNIVVRFRHSNTFNSGYDEISGATYPFASGIGFSGLGLVQPLSNETAGEDTKFLEQGLVKLDDSKLFLTGSLAISGNSLIDVTASGNTYAVLQILPWTSLGSTIYRKVYIRKETGNG